MPEIIIPAIFGSLFAAFIAYIYTSERNRTFRQWLTVFVIACAVYAAAQTLLTAFG